MFGKENRLSRIINPQTKRCLAVALDHGMALGPIPGIVKPYKTLELLKDWIDAVLINKGILTTSFVPDGRIGIILRASGGATIEGEDITQEGITSSVEEALRLDADALVMNIFVGSRSEHSTLVGLAKMADECYKWGLPLVGETAVGKDQEKRFDTDYIKLSTRVAAELGADLVKTYYTGERFEEVVEGCPVPILVAGGPCLKTEEQVLRMVYESLQKGAIGIAMGRNIWQSKNPIQMIKALHRIVHQGWSVEKALKETEGGK